MDERKKQAFARVDAKDGQMLAHFRQVVGIDTTVPPGNSDGTVIDVPVPQLQRLGFTTTRVLVPDDFVTAIPLPLEGPRVNLVAMRVR